MLPGYVVGAARHAGNYYQGWCENTFMEKIAKEVGRSLGCQATLRPKDRELLEEIC
jgi:hypothetical protein